jgi:aspartate aminotransferase-like enzyme
MSILWASLKCTLRRGDRLLAVASGLFGEGFSDMARAMGVEAETVSFPYDEVPDPQRVRDAVRSFHPRVVTAVHCETPSGTINPYLREIGEIAHKGGALFVVDFVSSAGGTPLNVDGSFIDIGLWGSQKVLSLTPSLSISTVSERAWDIIREVNYTGYEAYLPWREVPQKRYMPYTHDWQGMEALNRSLSFILEEGLDETCARHARAATLCRRRGQDIGLKLFPKDESFSSPTVTAFYVPKGWTWEAFNAELRKYGLAVGGNYGPLTGKVFRIGHMGSQADVKLVERGMKVIEEVLR